MTEQHQLCLVLSALLLCHYLGDFCLTTKSMIRAKSNGKEYFPILLHAGVHAMLMTLALALFGVSFQGCAVAFLIEKKIPGEKLTEVFKAAEEERKAGRAVLISVMKKNKKFQKDQLQAEGYTEIREIFAR